MTRHISMKFNIRLIKR